MKYNSKSGFSLVEVLIVVVIMGIIATLSYPSVIGLLERGNSQAAVGVAQSLNAAKQSFRMKHFKAEQEYSKQANEESRFALLQPYVANSSASLKQLTPKGYTIELKSGIRDRVVVRDSKGEIQY